MRRSVLGCLLAFVVAAATVAVHLVRSHDAAATPHVGSMASPFSVCYVTAPSMAVAEKIASHLVARKAAACVNILPGVTSVYTWQGKVEKDSELLLMIKTQTAVVPRLISEVRAVHPYDVPEVISVPMGAGHTDYLNWVTENTAVEAPPATADLNADGGAAEAESKPAA